MTQEPTRGRTIWCLGMYASASTWLFNVVRQVLQVAQQEKVQVAFISGKEKTLTLGGPEMLTLIKSHEINDDSRIVDVARHSKKIMITIRDPRDAVTSLMQAHGYDFDRALDFVERSARLCGSFAKDRRAKLYQYEAGFFEDIGTVRATAEYLGYGVEDATIQAIYGSLTRAEVEKHINKMPKMPGILRDAVSGDLLDTKTQWHSHHAGRNGEIGKWKKTLTAKQASEIERRVDFYFDKLQAL